MSGYDAHVSVEDRWNTTIRITWVLMSRPLVYKLMHEGDFVANMRKASFVKMVFTDAPVNHFNEEWRTGLPDPEPAMAVKPPEVKVISRKPLR